MKFGRIGRMAWYLCGAILVLSLPTFSYLIPKAELVMGPAVHPPVERSRAVPLTERFNPASSSLSRAIGGASSFVSSQPTSTRAVPIRPGRGQEHPATPLASPVQPGAGIGSRANALASASVVRGTILSPVRPGRRTGALGSYGSQAGTYPQDLRGLDQGYESAMGQLFQNYPIGFGGYRGNPFDDGPNDQETGGDSNDNNGDNGSGDQGGNNPPPDQGGDTPPPPPPVDGGAPAKRYSFLLIGEFEGVESTSRVFRSYREPDGSFVVEDKVRVNPFPGTVGGGNLLFPGENQQLFTDDLDGDGRLDLMFTEMADQGTILHLLLGDPSGSYPQRSSIFFVWKAISSIGLLDFNGDDQLDVAILFRNTSNLFVYTLEGGQFKYLKEIVLPFEPSVVVDSQFEGSPKERRLHVFDASFYQVATLTSSNPGIFLFGLSGGRFFKTYRLDAEVDGPDKTELQVYEESGGIALAEKRGGSWVVLGRFSTVNRHPLVVFGDYLNTGIRRLICLP